MNRSSRAEIRNPVLALPAAKALLKLEPSARETLADLLDEIRADARQRAETCWSKHKAPMAVYWKAVSVYAGHIAKALRRTV